MTERRRRFLFVSGVALVDVVGVGGSPSPRRRPVLRRRRRRRRWRPPRAADRGAADRRAADGAADGRRPTTTEAPTTAAPTTTDAADDDAAPTTRADDDCGADDDDPAPEPAAPSVVYAANAECDPASGQTTVTWKVTNNGEAPVTITGNTEDVQLEPNPVPPFGAATATTVIEARQPISR